MVEMVTMIMPETYILHTENICKSFGGLNALDNINFKIKQGEIRALIGSNGAGKTTFINILAGHIKPSSGKVFLKNSDITNLPPHKRVHQGIAYTFQITNIYQELSCLENIIIAINGSKRHNNKGNNKIINLAKYYLNKTNLKHMSHIKSGQMSYANQRLLEISMGLALNPQLLILDEPTQGLEPDEITAFCKLIGEIRKTTTILMIEHNMDVVMKLADQVTVFNFGEILAEGTPDKISNNPDVKSAYLG